MARKKKEDINSDSLKAKLTDSNAKDMPAIDQPITDQHVTSAIQVADGRSVYPSEALRKRGICKADSLMQLKDLQTLKELEFFASALFLFSE